MNRTNIARLQALGSSKGVSPATLSGETKRSPDLERMLAEGGALLDRALSGESRTFLRWTRQQQGE